MLYVCRVGKCQSKKLDNSQTWYFFCFQILGFFTFYLRLQFHVLLLGEQNLHDGIWKAQSNI